MRVGLLMCGTLSDEMLRLYPDGFDPLFKQSLLDVDPELEFQVYEVFNNDFPEDIGVCDGYVISGSKHGVYEALPWMICLETLIREIYIKEIPVVGLCFGHQIMAHALGGRVEKSDKGWGIGAVSYQTHGALRAQMDKDLCLYAVHQDQVMEKPKEAEVIADNDHCSYAALLYKGAALSFQPHPEFTHAFEKDLIKYLRNDPERMPTAIADQALKSLDGTSVDSRFIMSLIVRFLRHKTIYGG